MRLHEVVGLPDPAPLEDRRVVMYFSRNHGGTKPERSVSVWASWRQVWLVVKCSPTTCHIVA